jgi:hypothetical protein
VIIDYSYGHIAGRVMAGNCYGPIAVRAVPDYSYGPIASRVMAGKSYGPIDASVLT